MLYFNSLQSVDGKYIVFGTVYPAVYLIDSLNGNITYKKFLKGENNSQTNLICKSILLEDNIVYFTCYGDYIHILDTRTLEEKATLHVYKKCGFFSFVGILFNMAYLINVEAEELILIDLCTWDIKTIKYSTDGKYDKVPHTMINDGKIYVAFDNSNVIMTYNPAANDFKIMEIDACKRIAAISFIDRKFVIVPYGEPFILINGIKRNLNLELRDRVVAFNVGDEFYFGAAGSNTLNVLDSQSKINKIVDSINIYWGESINSGNEGYYYGENQISFIRDKNIKIKLGEQPNSPIFEELIKDQCILQEDKEVINLENLINSINIVY